MLPILERLLFRPTRTRVSRVLVLTPTRELAIQVSEGHVRWSTCVTDCMLFFQIHSVGKALAKHTNVEVCLAAGR